MSLLFLYNGYETKLKEDLKMAEEVKSYVKDYVDLDSRMVILLRPYQVGDRCIESVRLATFKGSHELELEKKISKFHAVKVLTELLKLVVEIDGLSNAEKNNLIDDLFIDDKALLLIAHYAISFEENPEFEVQCPHCGEISKSYASLMEQEVQVFEDIFEVKGELRDGLTFAGHDIKEFCIRRPRVKDLDESIVGNNDSQLSTTRAVIRKLTVFGGVSVMPARVIDEELTSKDRAKLTKLIGEFKPRFDTVVELKCEHSNCGGNMSYQIPLERFVSGE